MSSLSGLDINPFQTYGLHVFLPCPEVALSFVDGFLCWVLTFGAILMLIFALFLLRMLWRSLSGPPGLTAQGLLLCCAPLLLTQLVCSSMRVPFLRSSLGVGAFTHPGRPPLPVAPTLVPRSCPPSTAEGCVLPALSGLLHSGICPLPRSCPPPACMSTLPTCIFKACALHFAPGFPEK